MTLAKEGMMRRVVVCVMGLLSVCVLLGWQEVSVEEEMITEIDKLTAAFAGPSCTAISGELAKFDFEKMKDLMAKLRGQGQARTAPATVKPSVDLLERRMQEANEKCKADDAYVEALKKVGEGLSSL